jgi:hypothetical protein
MFLHPESSLAEKQAVPPSLISTSLVLLGFPFLPLPLRAAVTITSIAPLLVTGVYTLLTKGI